MSVSFLFVPADRPDRIAKAALSSADEVIVDLEDAVAPDMKASAREALLNLPSSRPMYVRVNGTDSAEFELDASVLGQLEWLGGIVLPKTEAPEQLQKVRAAANRDVPVVALIESAVGLMGIKRVVGAHPSRLALGSVDLASEAGVSPTEEFLATPRSLLVFASAAAGLPGPVDGPTLDLQDPDAVARDCRAAVALGMTAKFCIHPAQIDLVHQAFGPTPEELEWARAVVDRASDSTGAFRFQGRMVDAPVVARARRILSRWQG